MPIIQRSWFKKWLGTIFWATVDQYLCCYIASIGGMGLRGSYYCVVHFLVIHSIKLHLYRCKTDVTVFNIWNLPSPSYQVTSSRQCVREILRKHVQCFPHETDEEATWGSCWLSPQDGSGVQQTRNTRSLRWWGCCATFDSRTFCQGHIPWGTSQVSIIIIILLMA